MNEKCLINRILKFESYKKCLQSNEIILGSQQKFKSEILSVFTGKVKKIALSSNYEKRLQTFDGIMSYLYDTNAGKVCKTELLQYLKDIKWLTCRVPVKASSFIIDKSFSSFDKSGFLTSKQKWQTIWIKMGCHYIYIRKHWNIFKSLTGTLAWMVFLEEIKQSTI